MLVLKDRSGASHKLPGRGPWVVGRHVDADIVVADDAYCARRHFQIALTDGAYTITPISSSSPTFVDERQLITTTPIRAGAAIRFGKSEFQLERASANGDGDSSISLAHRRIIGREPGEGGLKIDHPTVSRKHARFGLKDGRPWLRDQNSTNGTFVNGSRLSGGTHLSQGDVVTIGPVSLVLRGNELTKSEQGGLVAISARAVALDVGKEQHRILQPCNVTIRKGEFVCLIGGSGAGKSTLMNVLSGRRVATEGSVEIMGADIATSFAALKPFMAYVPQREVLHDLLTVRQALGYIAELRLPMDMSADDRAEQIEVAAAAVELTVHLDKQFKMLSGGQKKRACLAAEILCKPQILFLDEVTSGLDEQTDFEIMQLLGQIAKGGTTIVCVTHSLANIVKFCDRVVIMGSGGHLVFSGPPTEALRFFGIERLGELYSLVTPSTASSYAQRFVREHAAAQVDSVQSGSRAWVNIDERIGVGRQVILGMNQFGVLIRRNLALLVADHATLQLVAIQALIIGFFVGWAHSDFGDNIYQVAASQKTLLTLLVMSVIWMGCNGASKDIVSESAIFRREKDVNLSISAYLFSKMLTAFVFVVFQICITFALASLFVEDMPGDDMSQLILLCMSGCIAVMMGLLISASAQSSQQATAIVPMLLVPQLIFIGSIVPNMPDMLKDISEVVVPTNVVNSALMAVFDEDGPIPNPPSPPDPVSYFEPRLLSETLGLSLWHFVILVVVTYLVLRWRYRRGTED